MSEPLAPSGWPLGLQAGTRLGGLRLQEVLGHGSTGVVVRAEQLSVGRSVAVKILYPELAADPDFIKRFLREAQLAAGLASNHVVGIHDAGVDAGHLFIAMEEMPGGDLEDLCRHLPSGRLTSEQVRRVMRDCARGLRALQQAGLVHRDVKPANIFLTADGAAKLGDLGLVAASAETDGGGSAGLVVGTPAYMSPEQAQGAAQVDHRSDIYALGATCYRLLTGEDPFPGADIHSVISKVRSQRLSVAKGQTLGPEGGLPGIIYRCMQEDPAARYADADALLADLERLREPDTAATSPQRPSSASSSRISVARRRPVARRGRQNRGLDNHQIWILAGISAVLMVLAVALWQILRH